MKLHLIALLCLLSTTAMAQWRNSPFPTNAPTAGYVLENAFPQLSFAFPDRLVGLTTNAGRLFVVDRGGRVYVITNLSSPTKTTFLDNRTLTDREGSWVIGDSGMFGFAVHPNGLYAYTWANETNRTTVKMVNRLSRWTIDPANTNRVLPGSKMVMIEQIDDDPYHSGGDIQFGPDGYLYVPLGDEGNMNGRLGNTQRIDRDFFSGMLRIDVDSKPGSLAPNPHPAVRGGYRVPPDNPWVGATTFNGTNINVATLRTEFWAVGLRNPHRMSFDINGDLYLGDVGNVRWEEFDKIVRGGNYGWNWMEGPEQTTFPEAPPISQRAAIPFIAPFWTYPHTAIAPAGSDPRFVGNSAIGGFVYRGTKYPSLNGKYICGDWANKHIWAITLSPQVSVQRIATANDGVNGFGMNPATGDILTVEFASGIVSKLVPAPDSTAIPPTLSATGLFTDVATLSPAPGVTPYEVASPFWSDFAVKSRWFFLPPGRLITRSAADEWSFPEGTVWMKHFDLPTIRGTTSTRRIETRFFIRTATGGYGLTYRWRSDQTDADLVPDVGFDTAFPVQDGDVSFNQPWHYPARVECSTCHNPVAGYALGFSTRQLNVPVAVEGGGTVNQLLGLTALGIFNNGFTDVSGLPRLSRPLDETATLEHRFKSYTDANCSYCHMPGGPGRGDWDARLSTPLAESSIINGTVSSDLGFSGGVVISPGDTNRSILFRRVADFDGLHQPAEYHMPPLATYERNQAGVQMLQQFIESLATPVRTSWLLGSNGPVRPRHAEFSIENRLNDPKPGSSTALDDDFYFQGEYPVGFNNLTQALSVQQDEPWLNWERANTNRDRTNRLHFVTGKGGTFTFTCAIATGGWSTGGITNPGFSTHDVTLRHTANGVATVIWQGTLTSPQTIVVPFTAATGANSIEIVRTGPQVGANSYYFTYDYLSVTSP